MSTLYTLKEVKTDECIPLKRSRQTSVERRDERIPFERGQDRRVLKDETSIFSLKEVKTDEC